MPREVQRHRKTYYLCQVCGLAYEEEKWAQACEDFCTQHHGCSLEITQHVVEIPEE